MDLNVHEDLLFTSLGRILMNPDRQITVANTTVTRESSMKGKGLASSEEAVPRQNSVHVQQAAAAHSYR
jgi:hypothetical protein